MSAEYPQVEVDSRDALRRWFEQHHETSGGIWLVTYKKGDPRYLPYEHIVEEALCFGWIDSKARRIDELRDLRQALDGPGLVRSLAGAPVVVCGHGGLETALGFDMPWKKGAVLVLDADLEILERLRA